MSKQAECRCGHRGCVCVCVFMYRWGESQRKTHTQFVCQCVKRLSETEKLWTSHMVSHILLKCHPEGGAALGIFEPLGQRRTLNPCTFWSQCSFGTSLGKNVERVSARKPLKQKPGGAGAVAHASLSIRMLANFSSSSSAAVSAVS